MANYFIDNQLKHYVGDYRLLQSLTYKTDHSYKCIYCFNKANSREHIPSKIFLDEPYNNELSILPACVKCNNSFSESEQYLACLIDFIETKANKNNTFKRQKVSKALNNRQSLLNELIQSTIYDNKNEINYIKYDIDKIEKVILKLSIGHAIYSLSEINLGSPKHINFKFLPELTQQEIDIFHSSSQQDISPEIGSREGMYITLSENDEPITTWKILQENQYRYLAFISPHNIYIRIVIGEYFFSEIIW